MKRRDEPTPIWDAMVAEYKSAEPGFGIPESGPTPPSIPPKARRRPKAGSTGNPTHKGANAPTRPAREPQAGAAGPTQEAP